MLAKCVGGYPISCADLKDAAEASLDQDRRLPVTSATMSSIRSVKRLKFNRYGVRKIRDNPNSFSAIND